MTKDEALNAIDRARGEYTWEGTRHQIRKIVEQIDQPQEFTVRELVELLKQARDGTSEASIDIEEIWTLASVSATEHEGQGIDSLRAKLLELVKPRMAEPETVMVPVPIKIAKFYASNQYFDEDCKAMKVACRAALEKAKL